MNKGVFFDFGIGAIIVSIVLSILSSASDEPKLSPRERARVPPPRSNYKVLSTNMPNRVEAPFTSTNKQERANASCVGGCNCRKSGCNCRNRKQGTVQTR